jgi:hypothetical protein
MNINAPRVLEHNASIAEALREAAKLLAAQDDKSFRVNAYLNGAKTIEELREDIAVIAARGPEALDALPHIGKSIASAIVQLTTTGRWSQLERLRGTLEPELVFQGIPGIGPVFAHLIHEHLHVDTLEALEAAAHDGRLDTVPGIGKRRIKIIQNSLASILERRRPMLQRSPLTAPPSVGTILDVDREYREKAAAGGLKMISPRRFNPGRVAWLPILHTTRDHWQFTALFSNTARAHELGKTADWVIIFFTSDHTIENQCTVVTETMGQLKGKRVVRAREKECVEFFLNSVSG